MTWLQTAVRPDVVKRAAKTALLVGSVLIVINNWGLWRADHVPAEVLWKMLLTACVPYCVSTYASVAALRSVAQHADDR